MQLQSDLSKNDYDKSKKIDKIKDEPWQKFVDKNRSQLDEIHLDDLDLE